MMVIYLKCFMILSVTVTKLLKIPISISLKSHLKISLLWKSQKEPLVFDINLEKLTDTAKRHLELIFAINMHLLMIALFKLLKEDILNQDILNDYYAQLEILKYGCLKEEEKEC